MRTKIKVITAFLSLSVLISTGFTVVASAASTNSTSPPVVQPDSLATWKTQARNDVKIRIERLDKLSQELQRPQSKVREEYKQKLLDNMAADKTTFNALDQKIQSAPTDKAQLTALYTEYRKDVHDLSVFNFVTPQVRQVEYGESILASTTSLDNNLDKIKKASESTDVSTEVAADVMSDHQTLAAVEQSVNDTLTGLVARQVLTTKLADLTNSYTALSTDYGQLKTVYANSRNTIVKVKAAFEAASTKNVDTQSTFVGKFYRVYGRASTEQRAAMVSSGTYTTPDYTAAYNEIIAGGDKPDPVLCVNAVEPTVRVSKKSTATDNGVTVEIKVAQLGNITITLINGKIDSVDCPDPGDSDGTGGTAPPPETTPPPTRTPTHPPPHRPPHTPNRSHLSRSERRLQDAIDVAEVFWHKDSNFNKCSTDSRRSKLNYGGGFDSPGYDAETWNGGSCSAYVHIQKSSANAHSWPRFCRTVTHEYGHMLGHHHVGNTSNIMFHDYTRQSVPTACKKPEGTVHL